MKILYQNGKPMTGIHNQITDFNTSDIAILHAELIPDCTNTDDYNAISSTYLSELSTKISDAEKDAISALLEALSSAASASRPALIAAFETAHPALFKRLYGDLITFFYSTEEAQKRIHALANAAPRERSPNFDPALLDAVIANQSGKRRL